MSDIALTLVRAGWDHLKQQRPVAAWASWRQALQVEPEHKAATHALHVLANAGDLPEAARSEWKFLTPNGESRRAQWDSAFRGQDMADLSRAASVFADLADGPSRLNQGLCLAWLGRNSEAIAALDQAIPLLANDDFEQAVRAGLLAEVLRQGGGAEAEADDLNHVVTLTWTPGGPDPAAFLDDRADVRPIPHPIDPVTGEPRLSDAKLAEWLDRPPVAAGSEADAADLATVRRVRATVVRSARSLRLSGTDPVLLAEAHAETIRFAGGRVESSRREATPLPLAFLDAAVWSVRLPTGLEAEAEDRLNRAVVERYYEGTWIARPRKGLLGLSPLAAGQRAATGDLAMRARLEAVVRFREQIGERPTTVRLYQGYPFDRLRRRLGLAPRDPSAIDPADPASMSPAELDGLDPAGLDDFALAEAYESAAALGEDRRTARFAAVLASRDRSTLARLDVPALVATLIRHDLGAGDVDAALGHLDRAQAISRAEDRRTFAIWRAEVQARAGRADAAEEIYRDLLAGSPDPALALDAAETLLDNGFDHHARNLARLALQLAEASGNAGIAAQAEVLL